MESPIYAKINAQVEIKRISMSKEQTSVPPSVPPGVDPEAHTIKFDYIKGTHFRVVHVDGAFGGVSPRGDIGMSVFNERWPIPTQTTYNLEEGGKVGNEITEERISREAVIREVEVELLMDLDVAKTMHSWLGAKIGELEGLIKIKASEEG
jgi:hypothetical protein